MQILQPANEWIMNTYGKTFREMKYGTNPQAHKFIFTIPEEDGSTLMYNGLTKELVRYEEGDDKQIGKFFDTMWMVPEGYDQNALVDSIRENLYKQLPKDWVPNGFTILTTTKCNARCFYCYERKIQKHNMTNETAKDVAEYIVKKYKETHPEIEKKENCSCGDNKNSCKSNKNGNNDLSLSWFGGEPLYNKQVIDIIVNRVKEEGIPYASSMISNGYLFDEETVKQAVELWHLKNVQITLDGTNENYRKAKNYIYDDKDPLETVMQNIERLSDHGIRVSIRVNVGYYNCEDIENLVDIAAERFHDKKNVSMYVHALFDNGAITDITDEERDAKVYGEMVKIEDKIRKTGIGKGRRVTNYIQSSHCMADNGRHAVIQCDGGISLCEHYVDSEKYSSIYSEKADESIREKFKQVSPLYPRCYSCPLVLDCSTLKMCEDAESDCTQARQNYKVEKKVAEIKMYAEEVKKRIEAEKAEIAKMTWQQIASKSKNISKNIVKGNERNNGGERLTDIIRRLDNYAVESLNKKFAESGSVANIHTYPGGTQVITTKHNDGSEGLFKAGGECKATHNLMDMEIDEYGNGKWRGPVNGEQKKQNKE